MDGSRHGQEQGSALPEPAAPTGRGRVRRPGRVAVVGVAVVSALAGLLAVASALSAGGTDLRPALHAYEALRRPVTERVVLTNRSMPPDFINIRVDELSGGRPFRHIDDLISQDELRRLSDQYKQVAGFSLEALRAGEPPVPPPAHV